MDGGGNIRPRPGGRDDAVARRRNREPVLPRLTEVDDDEHRLPANRNGTRRSYSPSATDMLSMSDPLPISRPNLQRPARKAASEPPSVLRSGDNPTGSDATHASDKTDRSHQEPSDGPNQSLATSRPSDPTSYLEYNLADLSEEQSYTTASDEPDWVPRHEPITAVPEDSGDQADSESSDTEPQRRAWFCRRPGCGHLNPGSVPLCQLCNAGRLLGQPMAEDGAARGAPMEPPHRARRASGDLCLICRQRPADHAFLHRGRRGRQEACRAACGSCAERRRRRRQPCPHCRHPIQMVITIIRH
ncbi:uncharacterized protein LOC122393651 [Amphibalanus amphitrite]|uniref:uncharacterized protein LOC122393651 n=1 Tax=Amphibalanus amphitrite TaxID=1232801 RepID=UPI001C90F4D4|nr:uncharacterized protein LOC122393651 [Amphibalanus amphitrite]XP_043245817.1 uncharacterized protein LOC122393651 [Amphibalanus amphitrite]XP_043245826.1 uncharacterized protein LOC122393651 [Amphibalanus amphitrite]